MSISRVGSIALVMMAACVDPDPSSPELGEVESEISSPRGQGSYYQGSYYQGSYYQGSYYQGSYYQGSYYQGSTMDGLTLSNGSVQGTALVVWTPLGSTLWMQRFPDKYCLWNATKTQNYGCTPVNLNVEPSPLAGIKFQAAFTNVASGATFQGHVRIAADSGAIGAVTHDNKLAMHPLTSNADADAAGCQLVELGQAGPDGAVCENPNKCRVNCDLWLYDLDLLQPDGTTLDFCPGGERAYAIAGSYAANGTYSPTNSTRFTFACLSGTIAKCTFWGYRPFGSARTHCNDAPCTPAPALLSMLNYHRSCIRGAMADYCANGHSFTKNGTLVDIYDFETHTSTSGFIPRTQGLIGQGTAYMLESGWDRWGAHQIDNLRYEELVDPTTGTGGVDDPAVGCPGRFDNGDGTGDVLPPHWRTAPAHTTPTVWIDSTTSCAHSERTVGKWLDSRCNSCIQTNTTRFPAYCTRPSDPRGWDSTCVARANQYCTESYRLPMTSHSECTAGDALDKTATGCTLRVCMEPGYESCCTVGWTSACVNAAKSYCKGGQESAGRFANFCSSGLVPPPPPPTTTTKSL
ncbi:MAG TPA: ADYC domain-containing protein [Kofleriaceae bacterium]|nr:ADYC domain-containing protein [Kofleriaceae bacterium]